MRMRALSTALLFLGILSSASGAESGGVRVELGTELGTILVEALPKAAPLSACDFLAYVDGGLYEEATFYRVVRLDNDHGSPKIEVVQGGLQDDSKGRPPIAHETTAQTGLRHVDGALSLARGAVGTGGAGAFFVVIGNQPGLDHGGERNKDRQGFAVFGRVLLGMDIVRRIHRMKADAPVDDEYMKGQLLAKPIKITGAKRLDALPKVCSAPQRS
jgi:peptidyl-prolyl cis-trans isomerase A (cyclophilin A)